MAGIGSTLLKLSAVILITVVHNALGGILHPGRLHSPPICQMEYINGSLACSQICTGQSSCVSGLPWHLSPGLLRLGVNTNSVRFCWEQPCTSTSCPVGYSCENHFWRRRCYRSPCSSDGDCPRGMECTNFGSNLYRRCYPALCGFQDFCPQGFTCLDRGVWRRCYPDQCTYDWDCPVSGSRCIDTAGGRLCRSPVGSCDGFLNTHHEEWH